MIISNFPNYIQRIIKNSEEDFYQVVNGCRHCGYGGNLHRHGSYHRTVICKEITTRVKIQRVICPDCRKTHAIIPYFQHTIETVVKLLELVKSKKVAYTKIIGDFKMLNQSILLGHVTFYINRFESNIKIITYYFRVYCDIFLDLPVRDCDVINKLLGFKLTNFNRDYFIKLNKYFLAKDTIRI